MVKNWIALFSQTGSEIADISEKLGKSPDLVITNNRPDHLRTMDPEITSQNYILHETLIVNFLLLYSPSNILAKP